MIGPRGQEKFQARWSGLQLPLGFVPPVWLGDSLVCTSVASDGGHDLEVIYFDRLFHHLHGFEISKHVSGSRSAEGGILPRGGGEAHPTAQMLPLFSIALATSKESLSSSNSPVAMGFSTNIAIPGNCFKIWVSISRPGTVLPRNIGGLPMMTALGYSFLVIVLTNSSKSLQTLVLS